MQIQDSVAGILAVPSASKQQAIATWEGDKKSVSRSEKTGRRGRGQVSEKTGRGAGQRRQGGGGGLSPIIDTHFISTIAFGVALFICTVGSKIIFSFGKM